MALENGYIKLHRKIINWRWYKAPLTKHLFEHLLIIANIEESNFENITVKRGECVSSIRKLAADTGLTEKEVRTALKHLKGTQEVAQTAYPKFSVFTINNYDLYQAGTQTGASKGQAKGKQGAGKGQHNKKDNNDKKNKEEKECIGNAPTPPKKSFGEFSHVLLTDEQHEKLINEYGESKTALYILKLDEYIEQTGKKYNSHYITIKTWIRKDDENNGRNERNGAVQPSVETGEKSKYAVTF